MHDWGLPETHNAQSVAFSSLTKEQGDKFEKWIWEPARPDGFAVEFDTPVVRRM